MPEQEKIISELQSALEWCGPKDNPNGSVAVKLWAVRGAIAMLKEQNNCENCAIAIEDRQPVVRCKDCKYRSLYCTEATDGTTLYTCHHPCANDVPRPFDWFCADGERKDDDA